jgi:hypothetical protein
MTQRRAERRDLDLEQRDQRMRRQQPRHDDRQEIDHLLDLVHGKSRPRPDLDVDVVDVMDRPVERRPVKYAARELEVRGVNDGCKEHQQAEPDPPGDRAGVEPVKAQIAVGELPQ